MDPVIQPWVGLWDYLDGNFWGVWRWAAASLSPEEVAWQPNPQVASIGWNLQHLGEMLDYYLAHVFRPCSRRRWSPCDPAARMMADSATCKRSRFTTDRFGPPIVLG